MANQHNASLPRDHWLSPDEKERICAFARQHPSDGYRRLSFMMLDADVVACSPSSVYRVLKQAGMLAGSSPLPSKKGTGFIQPTEPHQHWHIDISYLNIAGTFYYLCSILDGYSRFIVHYEIREQMTEADVEIILQRARECHPGVTPRIISDNGPQFVAREFKEFIRLTGMSHVKTSPYYPQSNGKIERWHKSLKGDCIRVKVPLSLEDARRIVADYVEHYNSVRLHSAIDYLTPKDKLEGRGPTILAERQRKLAEARQRRKQLQKEAQQQCQGDVTRTEEHRCHRGVTGSREGQCHHGVTDSQHKCQGDVTSTQTERPKECRARLSDRPAIDFQAVRAAVRMASVLELLGFEARTRRGCQLRGGCPLHGSTSATSRCFSVNLEQGLFQCFKCGRKGNVLDLWISASGQAPYDAAVDLCERLGITVPLLTKRNREEEPVEQGNP